MKAACKLKKRLALFVFFMDVMLVEALGGLRDHFYSFGLAFLELWYVDIDNFGTIQRHQLLH